MARYIDAKQIRYCWMYTDGKEHDGVTLQSVIDKVPTANVVEAEKYNDLRETFIDFVCSGIPNPAPYCKNRRAECVDKNGWCTYGRCNGFDPDGSTATIHDVKRV